MSDGCAQVIVDTVSDGPAAKVVVVVRGEVDAQTAPQLRVAMWTAIDEGMRHVELDASGLDFIDSSGLGVVIAVLKRLRPLGGSFAIRGASREFRQLLEITDLLGHIHLVDR